MVTPREAHERNERLRALLEEQRRNPIKRCPRCGRTLPLSSFGPNRQRSSGRASWCRDCCREATRRWRAEHPEHAEAYNAGRRQPDVTRVCVGCGVTFTGRPNKLSCSRRCARRVRERRRYERQKGER